MNLADPNVGEFEYTDYFHMVWLWNPRIRNVLMLGLGGGSVQRLFEYYYPGVRIQTAEIDPLVKTVAVNYFHFAESDRQRLAIADGRQFLEHTADKYDAILIDAYTLSPYGLSLPPWMVTKEFFELVKAHLAPGGVVASNVVNLPGTDILAAIDATLQAVFPQVYGFQCQESPNVVAVATLSGQRLDLAALENVARPLVSAGRLQLPRYLDLLKNLQPTAPSPTAEAPVLTDNFAPVERLMTVKANP